MSFSGDKDRKYQPAILSHVGQQIRRDADAYRLVFWHPQTVTGHDCQTILVRQRNTMNDFVSAAIQDAGLHQRGVQLFRNILVECFIASADVTNQCISPHAIE